MIIFKSFYIRSRFFSSLGKSSRTVKGNFKGSFQEKLFLYVSRHCDVNNQDPKMQQSRILKDVEIKSSIPVCRIFHLLDVEMRSRPGFITSTSTFKNTMQIVPQILHGQKLDKHDLIKLLFYVGLQKKTHQARVLTQTILLRIQDCLQSLTLEDSCILANTVFKTSTTNIDSSIIIHIKSELDRNFNTAIEDPAILLCLIKLLRLAKYNDYDLLERLTNSSSVWAKNVPVIAHVLALFAEARYLKQHFMQIITKKSLAALQDTQSLQESENNYLEKRLRAKDVSRYLWACSFLGYYCDENEVNQVIWPQLIGRLQHSREYMKQPAVLVDSLMSLCIMGHYSKQLMDWCFSTNVQQILTAQKQVQPFTKLKLLLAAAQIECPEHVTNLVYEGPQLPHSPLHFSLKHRKPLHRVYDAVQFLSPNFNLAPPQCQFQISPLHIAGIVLKSRQTSRPVLHLEVADSSVCLHESNLLTGLMKLKIRLLTSSGIQFILLGQKDLTDDDATLFVLLEDILHKHFH